MKDYHEMADRVLARRDQYVAAKNARRKQAAAAISCCCLCALVGIGIRQSGRLNNGLPTEEVPTAPEHGSAASEYSQGVEQKEILTTPENSASEAPVLSTDIGGAPLAPAAADLTKEALYEKMSPFLPDEAPAGFSFASATFSEYGYSVLWSKGMDELNWRIRDLTAQDAARITRVADTKNYDLALYPIPRAESVPEELRQIVDDPIFRWEELTPAAVNARAYKANDAGDSDGYRMHFSVLYGSKVITIRSKGVSPTWLYGQLAGLSGTLDAPMPDEAGDSGALNPFDEVWGGSYLSDAGNWVVWLTEDTAENRAEVFRRNPNISKHGTVFKTAEYPLAYLTQLMADVSAAMSAGQLPFVSSAALREDCNRVEIRMTDDRADLAARVQQFDTRGGAIKFQYDTSAATPTTDLLVEPIA